MKSIIIYLLMLAGGIVATAHCQSGASPDARNPFSATPEIRTYLKTTADEGDGIDSEIIRVTGVMFANGGKMAILEIDNMGSMAVRQGEVINLEGEEEKLAFRIRSITHNGVSIQMEDGEEIWCEYE